MGSSGSGSFGNYKPKADRCDDPIDTDLEDILHSEYYAAHGALPAKGTPVRLRPTLLNRRLVVDETKTGLAIGNLPTQYNYLRLCMEQGGRSYEGTVTVSKSSKLPTLEVHLDPV